MIADTIHTVHDERRMIVKESLQGPEYVASMMMKAEGSNVALIAWCRESCVVVVVRVQNPIHVGMM